MLRTSVPPPDFLPSRKVHSLLHRIRPPKRHPYKLLHNSLNRRCKTSLLLGTIDNFRRCQCKNQLGTHSEKKLSDLPLHTSPLLDQLSEDLIHPPPMASNRLSRNFKDNDSYARSLVPPRTRFLTKTYRPKSLFRS